jgi:hypothetical protein
MMLVMNAKEHEEYRINPSEVVKLFPVRVNDACVFENGSLRGQPDLEVTVHGGADARVLTAKITAFNGRNACPTNSTPQY